MEKKADTPYVPAQQTMAEFTVKAVLLGILMAIFLGAANAYVGMKAGLTVAATFPAAVVAMALLKPLKGTILEENIARTTASVGEALVAGAIFTIPAFVIAGAWEELRYLEATIIMAIGGVLGVLLVIILRRSLVVEADLPFPESVAVGEVVKAGQKGQTGASLVFGAMGIAALWELFKNSYGLKMMSESISGFFSFGSSSIEMLGQRTNYQGGMLLATPSASPMLAGVGFIVGPRISAVLFSGALMGWLLLVPLSMFLNPSLIASLVATTGDGMANGDFSVVATEIWLRQVRPLAVGTMIISAFYTLIGLRQSLVSGIRKALTQFSVSAGGEQVDRTEIDLDFKKVFIAIGLVAIPMFFLYGRFSGSYAAAALLTVVMLILGFLFAAVAGYLVGLIGSSNNPISGLTLSALLIAAVLMVVIGVTDVHGVAGVLAVAGVVCCTAGIAGDMMQDLKVGHILGGTPWRMQFAEILGVLAAACVLALPLIALDRVYHIGSADLPAPQAGLMAMMANGIVGGEMAWPLVIAGMFLGLGLILIKAPAPMLIAVGMYLPFESTAAIFVGGIIRWILDKQMERRQATEDEKVRAENTGILLSSGFIAGESLMAVAIALLVIGADLYRSYYGLPTGEGAPPVLPVVYEGFWVSLLVYPLLLWLLVFVPLKKMREGGMPATRIE
jgi:putative OPT family oligopeptide transporter